jgi:hypothetical protein
MQKMGENRSLGMKSYSQHELKNVIKDRHSEKNQENPFKNLNAAVNELNGNSVKPKHMSLKQENFDSESTTIDKRKYERRRSVRRDSGSLMQKEIKEETIEFSEEDTLRITAQFDSLPKNVEELDQENMRKRNPEFDVFYMSVNQELELPSRPINKYKPFEKNEGSFLLQNEIEVSKKNQSTKKTQIPRDYKHDSKNDRFNSKKMKKSKLNEKTNQLSINLRKGSPCRAEVDLFASQNISPPIDTVANIKKVESSYSPSQSEIENIDPLEKHPASLNFQPSQRLSFSSSASCTEKGHRKQVPSTRYDNAEELEASEVSGEGDFEAEKRCSVLSPEGIREKYEGILKQNTFNQESSRTHKSFMSGLTDTEFVKEANRTIIDKEKGVKARGLSQNRLDNVWKKKQVCKYSFLTIYSQRLLDPWDGIPQKSR